MNDVVKIFNILRDLPATPRPGVTAPVTTPGGAIEFLKYEEKK